MHHQRGPEAAAAAVGRSKPQAGRGLRHYGGNQEAQERKENQEVVLAPFLPLGNEYQTSSLSLSSSLPFLRRWRD